MRIAVLATGIGNVRSVVRALERVGGRKGTIETTADADVVRHADVLVVPGQGSFGAFASALAEGGLREALGERIAAGVPYLGICLGLQVLFEDSEEAPGAKGLGVLGGRVRRLAAKDLALPHIGWNDVESRDPDLLKESHYYFAHTFAAAPTDPSVTLATTTYGDRFASAVRKDNVVGVQFHPEKSQRAGLLLVERFFATVGR